MTDRGLAALATHRLMLPPHPDGFYQSSALCSCGKYQWDEATGESVHLNVEAVARGWWEHILGERGVFLPDDSAVRAFTAWLATDGPEEQAAEISRLREIEEAYGRGRLYVENNLAVWSDDEATNRISMAICDVYRKVLNVMDTGDPLRAALEDKR